MNVQDEIKALKQRISELENQVEQEKEFLRDGDDYWYIDDEISVFSTTYENHYMDRCRQTIGNIFKTEEQAEFAVEKLKVEAELRKFSRPFEPGENNYHINFDTSGKIIDIGSLYYRQMQGTICFESNDKAQQSIESVGEDRIKKYIFGVED